MTTNFLTNLTLIPPRLVDKKSHFNKLEVRDDFSKIYLLKIKKSLALYPSKFFVSGVFPNKSYFEDAFHDNLIANNVF
jgi:hypothetical protein